MHYLRLLSCKSTPTGVMATLTVTLLSTVEMIRSFLTIFKNEELSNSVPTFGIWQKNGSK